MNAEDFQLLDSEETDDPIRKRDFIKKQSTWG